MHYMLGDHRYFWHNGPLVFGPLDRCHCSHHCFLHNRDLDQAILFGYQPLYNRQRLIQYCHRNHHYPHRHSHNG